MRYQDGSGYPGFALVLGNTGSKETGPAAAYAGYQVPAHAAFRARSSPQQQIALEHDDPFCRIVRQFARVVNHRVAFCSWQRRSSARTASSA